MWLPDTGSAGNRPHPGTVPAGVNLAFPLTITFKFSLFTELRVTDASGQLIAVVKEKTFSIRDEVRVFSDEGRAGIRPTACGPGDCSPARWTGRPGG